MPIHTFIGLNINVKTDKASYYNSQIVHVFGNLTQDDVLVTDGLVGLQVQNPQDEVLVIRTLSTGEPPHETPYIQLEYVAPCDSEGNPKFSFLKGALAYFKVSLANLDIEGHNVTITFNLYYNDTSPFGSKGIRIYLAPGSHPVVLTSIPIPSDAVLGTSKVYASAFTNWPKLGGAPYCNEVSATFNIVSSSFALEQDIQGLKTFQTNETGNYNATFKLPRNVPMGNYAIYVTSRYLGQYTFNSTTFTVNIIGDLGSGTPPQFFLFDGKVDSRDLNLFLQCYKKTGP